MFTVDNFLVKSMNSINVHVHQANSRHHIYMYVLVCVSCSLIKALIVITTWGVCHSAKQENRSECALGNSAFRLPNKTSSHGRGRNSSVVNLVEVLVEQKTYLGGGRRAL